MRIEDMTIHLYIIIIHKNKDQKALHSFIVDIGFTLQKAMNATMHIVNFLSKCVPILYKFTCIPNINPFLYINDQFALPIEDMTIHLYIIIIHKNRDQKALH